MLATVVIPTFERPAMVAAAVESALLQTAGVGEVIVVDDNRDDAMVRATAESLSKFRDPRLRIVRNTRAKGGCGSRNSGISIASSEFIAFLDDDDVLLPDAIISQLALFRNELTGMVYGGSIVVDEMYRTTERIVPAVATLSFQDLLSGACPNSSSVVMVRRKAIVEAGLFDETLPSFQDYDMWLRIVRKYEARANPNLIAKFIHHDSERASVNIERRMQGLQLIIAKWGDEMAACKSAEAFRSSFLSAMYLSNGHVALATGKRRRKYAIECLYSAFCYSQGEKQKYLIWLFAGILGFNATRLVKKLKALA